MGRQALAPAAKPHSTAVQEWQSFEGELRRREQELAALLPPHISRDKFMNTAVIAAKNNPALLKCNRRQFHAAVTRAAEDGLLPDGREGVINVYGADCAWIPMVYGIRKRARELCGIIIDAQVVHQNDTFVWSQGDDPSITHQPAALGSNRGPMIGAYAIIKIGEEILHREVMDKTQIEAVKSTVRAKGGLLWTKFEPEAWRKTVVRRAVKTIPSVHPKIGDFERIVSRDDDQFEVAQPARMPVLDVPADIPDDIEDAPAVADPAAFLKHIDEEYGACGDFETLEETAAGYAETIGRLAEADQGAAEKLYALHLKRVKAE